MPDELFVRVPGESEWVMLPALHLHADFSSKSQAEKMGNDGQMGPGGSRAYHLGTEGKEERGVSQKQAGSGERVCSQLLSD